MFLYVSSISSPEAFLIDQTIKKHSNVLLISEVIIDFRLVIVLFIFLPVYACFGSFASCSDGNWFYILNSEYCLIRTQMRSTKFCLRKRLIKYIVSTFLRGEKETWDQ